MLGLYILFAKVSFKPKSNATIPKIRDITYEQAQKMIIVTLVTVDSNPHRVKEIRVFRNLRDD